MPFHFQSICTIPEQTVRVAKAAFPKDDNLYIKMRDELGCSSYYTFRYSRYTANKFGVETA